jgi:hypothetical protein
MPNMQNPNYNRNLNINISNGSLIKSLGGIQNNKNNTIYNNHKNNMGIINPDNFLTPNLLQSGTNKNLLNINNLNKFKVINSTSADFG